MDRLVNVHINNNIGWLTMTRSEKLNALSKPLVQELIDGLDQLNKDETVKVIVLQGEGKAFCAGGDIASMREMNSSVEASEWVHFVSSLSKKVMDCDKYVIASVHGYAAGAGFSLAVACDFIVAEVDAKFALSFSNIGLIPDLGLIQLLSKRISPPLLKEWISSGKTISSDEALEKGIINRVARGTLEEEVKEFSRFIVEGPGVANKYIKYLVNYSEDVSTEGAFMTENMVQSLLLQSDDHKEGVEAFLEKRQPNFL